MRHSQGDHWDLMILEPAGENWMIPTDYSSLVSFQHDFLVKSSWSWKDVKSRSASAGLFHIEMFHAAVGHKADILQQRFMVKLSTSLPKTVSKTIFPGRLVAL